MSEDWVFPTANERHPNGYLSPSTIKAWRVCARCLFLDKVAHQAKPLGAPLVIGSAVHKGIEHAGRVLLGEKGYDLKDAIGAAESAFEDAAEGVDNREAGDRAAGERTELIPLMGDERSRAKDEAMRLSAWAIPYFADLYRARGLLAVEKYLDDEKNPFPFPVTGRVDAMFPNLLTDTKTAGQKALTGMNDRIQGGIYGLFEPDMAVVFDTLVKNRTPYVAQFEITFSPAARTAVYDHVIEIAEEIRDGYLAYLEGDWRTVNRCFPIGQGFIGRHDYDHSFPEVKEVLQVRLGDIAV